MSREKPPGETTAATVAAPTTPPTPTAPMTATSTNTTAVPASSFASDADASAAALGPPSLAYSLRARHLSLFLFWSLVIIDSVAMPIALYFGLWYGTDLSPNAVFSIVTAALGGVSIAEYVWRLWKLVKNGSVCRPEWENEGKYARFYLDTFHWCFSFMWVVIIAELVIGTCFTNPPIRLLSMPLASALFVFGTLLLVIDGLRLTRTPTPFPLSTQRAHGVPRPALYPFIEDVIAVDGGGHTEYRRRLDSRYAASPVFRRMLARLSLFWGFGAMAAATLTTVLVFVLERDVSYVIGWTLPWVWTGIWLLLTWAYVKRELRRERETWTSKELA
ncbi:hypothetical protein Q5752_000094 [Cryptotrichosporon argae]